MRILVTGAAGFMGSWIAEELLKGRHHWVLGVDDLSGGTGENLHYWEGPFSKFVLQDLRDPVQVDALFRWFKPEIVYHLAAHPHEGLSQFAPYDVFTTTAVTSINVFRAAVKCGAKKIVFTSSMARYGHGNYSPPFAEDTHPRAPVDVYGAAKVASEVALEALSQAHGMDYTIIVPRNVAGPRQARFDAQRNVLAIWINMLLRGKDIYIYGDGKQERTFSDIQDSLPCYIRAAFSPEVSHQVINIGSTHKVTINEAADLVLSYFPDRTRIHIEDRPCEVKHAYCTSDKATRLLGFEHKTDLPELVARMVTWMRDVVGPLEPVYYPLEIPQNAPRTWREHLI